MRRNMEKYGENSVLQCKYVRYNGDVFCNKGRLDKYVHMMHCKLYGDVDQLLVDLMHQSYLQQLALLY